MSPDPHHRIEQLLPLVRPGGRLLRVWPLEGGVSAVVTAFEVALPDDHRESLVMRCHGVIDKGHKPDIAQHEFRLLLMLNQAGFAVPAPVWADAEPGSPPCLVVEFVDGSTGISPSKPEPALRQMATFLTRLHALDHVPPYLPRRDDPTEDILRHVALWPDSSLRCRVGESVATHAPFSPANAPVLLHGDFWPGNILWHDGRIAAVLDWEDAAIGDPLADLAGARLELLWRLGPNAMKTFTSHYLSAGRVDPENLPWWELFVATGALAHMAKWGLDPETEATMRRQAKGFTEHAMEVLTGQPGHFAP